MTEDSNKPDFAGEEVPSLTEKEVRDSSFIKTKSEAREKNLRSGCCLGVIITVSMIIFLAVIGFIGLFAVKVLFNNAGLDISTANDDKRFEERKISGESSSNNKIIVMHINGIIQGGQADSDFDSSSGGDASSICRRLKKIEKDKDLKALILYINTPGGEVVAADRIYHAVMELKKKRKIPVVAWFDSMAASGGYYVGCSADWIVSHELCTTGSIGVVIQSYKYYDLFKKIGIASEPYHYGKLKDILSGSRPTTPEEKEIINDYVKVVYDRFIQVVVKGRKGLTAEQIADSEIGDSRIFLGIQAKELGLVDQLGYFEDSVKKAAELAKLKDYKVVVNRPKISFLSLFGVESKAPDVNINLPGTNSKSPKIQLEPGKFYYIMPQ